MLVWLDKEVTEVLFESIHTSGHRRLSKNIIKALHLQKTEIEISNKTVEVEYVIY